MKGDPDPLGKCASSIFSPSTACTVMRKTSSLASPLALRVGANAASTSRMAVVATHVALGR